MYEKNLAYSTLDAISRDLKAIIDGPEQTIKPTNQYADLYIEVQHRFLYKPMRQSQLRDLGASKGACYGFTFSMADSAFNPYTTPQDIKLNQTIHDYQTHQHDRINDQQKIKQTRIQGKRFCPSPQQRAEEFYQLANQNLGNHLCISLRTGGSLHAVYLSIQENGDIRYMDANHGAFLFKNKEDFIAAYRVMELWANAHWTFYEVSQLREDKNLEYQEIKTWTGKLRSFLTGAKYPGIGSNFIHVMDHLLLGSVVSLFMGAVIGFAIGNPSSELFRY